MERITPKSGRTLRGTAMALSKTGKPILTKCKHFKHSLHKTGEKWEQNVDI